MGLSIDREKVIKEFEHMLNEAKGDYYDFVDLTVDFGEEILALLKEQEPVKPISISKVAWLYKCECGNHFTYKVKYCEKCGRSVKWNENT